jgi:hypothetical protein
MKTLSALTNCLALSALLLTAQAQTPTTPAKPTKSADKQATPYQGPKIAKDSKALGRVMVQKSKPADAIMTSVRELPVKK